MTEFEEWAMDASKARTAPRPDVVVEVARRYTFRGRHHVPDLPAPWCESHDHDYTVEVVARGSDSRVIVDTDVIDRAWASLIPSGPMVYLDVMYGPQWTAVEALSQRWLADLSDLVPEVFRVVVWEDDNRWGSATAP